MSLTIWRAAIDVSRAVIGTAAYATVPAIEDHLIIPDLIVITDDLRSIHFLCFLVLRFA
jgi:hypothetical protein